MTINEFVLCSLQSEQIGAYRDSIVKIADDVFGIDCGEEIYADIEQHPDAVIRLCLNTEKIMMGFGYGYVAKPGTLEKIIGSSDPTKDYDVSLLEADKQGKIGVIKIIAISPSFQKRGAGIALIKEIGNEIDNLNGREILVPAWESGGRINIKSAMEKTGFKKWLTITGFWKKACDNKKFICSDRQASCVCNSIFYRKTL